jgi:hypothetical protein
MGVSQRMNLRDFVKEHIPKSRQGEAMNDLEEITGDAVGIRTYQLVYKNKMLLWYITILYWGFVIALIIIGILLTRYKIW